MEINKKQFRLKDGHFILTSQGVLAATHALLHVKTGMVLILAQ